MPDNSRNRNWLDSEEKESSAPGLPRPDLNPLVNPLLGRNMGRWAEVYFTSPPDQREHAVEKLVQLLEAESGGKKPAVSDVAPVVVRDIPPTSGIAAPDPEEEFDSDENFEPPQPPIPVFGKFKPGPVPVEMPRILLDDAVVCERCSAGNAVKQRFCGTCGAPLTPESPPAESVTTEAQPVDKADSRPANAESDWGWLRERTLSGYEPHEKPARRSRVLLPIALFAVLGIAGYIFLRSRSASTQAPTPATAPAGSPANTSANHPVVPPASNTTDGAERAPLDKKSSSPAKVRPAPAQPPSSPAAESPAASDDGRDDLEQAQRYLSGEGVPKNSWMASHFLWKAVAKENEQAVLLLSDLYARGDGVSRSCEQARVLLVSAAKKGSSAAAHKLRSIEQSCR